jgi:uncharacterized protein (DUF697 family)
MSSQEFDLDQNTIDQIKADFLLLLEQIFGTDIDIDYQDGLASFNVVGGDLALVGTASGNTVEDLQKLVQNKVLLRILTYYQSSPLLPPNFGSYIGEIVGLTIVDDDDITAVGVVSQQAVRSFVEAMVALSLQDEPLVQKINHVVVEFDRETLFIDISVDSVFLRNINMNLSLFIGE